MEAVPDVAHRLVTHYGETIKIQFNGTFLQRVGVEIERMCEIERMRERERVNCVYIII